jgi:hypothetical protein
LWPTRCSAPTDDQVVVVFVEQVHELAHPGAVAIFVSGL